jgi:DNA-binding SARP family transcriptional activator
VQRGIIQAGSRSSFERPVVIRLALLGGFELTRDDCTVTLVTSAQRLLVFLALHDRPLTRAYVAGVLWPDVSEERSKGSLRSALWRLRLPGLHLCNATGQNIQLAANVTVDVREARGLARRVTNGGIKFPDIAFGDVLSLGDLLPGWYEDWVLIERERHRQISLHALEALCDGLAAEGRFAQAVLAGLAAVEGDPLRESAHRALVRTHLAEGNPCEALRQYHLYARLLRQELDLEPSETIKALVGGLTAESPSRDASAG